MNTNVLAFISSQLSALGIDYSLFTKNGPATYPYFVGSYVEQEEATESGEQKVVFTLDGWTDGSWLELEQIKKRLADTFRSLTAMVDGYGVSINYSSSTPVPQEDVEMKRIQINFDVRIWRYN